MPPPETPVTAVKVPSGISAETFLRLLPVAPVMARRRPFAAGRRSSGTSMPRAPERYWPVSEAGFAMISSGVPSATMLAAMDAGAGADIDDMVGGEDGVLVMLHHDDGVAEVAQVPQRLQQAGVVALVQADRRLVEHVEHAGQAGADLARRGGCAGSRRRRACRRRARA